MDHLSSCYFCGTALDDTLRDYRVVPAELRATDDTTTATLCQSCHGKLERLLAPVVEATGADGDEEDPLLGGVESDLVDIDEEPLTETGGAVSPDPLAGSEATQNADSDVNPGGEADTEDEHDDGKATGENAENQGEETVRIRHETDTTATGEETEPSAGEREDSDARGQPEREDGIDTGGDAERRDEGDTGQETEDDTDAGGDSDDGGGSDVARTTISALEHNKVMRLLQNRDFPVDRREFVTVAANAYGLAEHECAAVIDLAVDRGLVGERDDQLVRPD